MLRTSDYRDISRLTINDRYSLVKQIGSGSFGKIYLGLDKESDGEEVAIKLEPVNSSTPLLSHEYKAYKILNGFVGFAHARWFGEVRQYNALVMDLLGPSLEQLFQSCNCRFTMKTVLMLADQMIARIEVVHCKSLLHRDIKPENFLMGTGKDRNKVYLIDFGLTSVFRDRKSLQHINYEENRPLIGTTRYASVNNHLGVRQSRRDDMESLGYTLLYFLRGKLPWQGLAAKTRMQRYEKIAEMKMSTSVEELCKELPFEFERYLKYCRTLRFEEQPNYTYLRQLFRILFRALGHKYDYMYDWTSLNKKTTNSTLDANTAKTGGAAETPTCATQMTRAVAEPDSSTAPETRGEVEGARITAPGTRAEAMTPTIAAPGKRAEAETPTIAPPGKRAEADTASFSSGTRSEDKTANIPKAVAETPRIATPGTRAEAETASSIEQTKTGERCSNCDGGHWTMQCPFVDKDDRQRRIGNNVKHDSANQRRIMKNYSMDECITMLKEAELRRKEEAKEYEQFRELIMKTSVIIDYRTSLAESPSKSDDVFGD